MRTPLSAVVICQNEEKNIASCIRSLQLVTDDVIIIDSGSEDDTIAISKAMNARVYQHSWQGYAKQKSIGNKYALHDFILSLDADEELSPSLAQAITREMENPCHDAYELKFRNFYEGKLVRHGGWSHNTHVRIFRKSRIGWDESLVHEKLSLDGIKVKTLAGHVHHYTASSRNFLRTKLTRYAEEFAQHRISRNQYSPSWKKYISTVFRFVKEYLFKLGFLDGRAGWQIAFEEANYTFLKYKWSEIPGENGTINHKATDSPTGIYEYKINTNFLQ
jgi:glycosyltransferase involved in cell wall biosynthesis